LSQGQTILENIYTQKPIKLEDRLSHLSTKIYTWRYRQPTEPSGSSGTDQIEADDLLGIMLTNGRIENPILCSIDKDMLGIPGWHYNWNKDAWPTYVSQDEADHHWLVQLLTGDSTDGIRGMEGIGPVKANKLIKQYRSIMNLHSVPEMAKYIYENEEINLDRYYETLYLVSIWRANMPEELLANDLIASIVKTIPSIN
jgi:hypothetical protein